MTCDIQFKAAGWGNSGRHEVDGKVLQSENKILATLSGKWSESLSYKTTSMSKEELMWKANPMPEKHDW